MFVKIVMAFLVEKTPPAFISIIILTNCPDLAICQLSMAAQISIDKMSSVHSNEVARFTFLIRMLSSPYRCLYVSDPKCRSVYNTSA